MRPWRGAVGFVATIAALGPATSPAGAQSVISYDVGSSIGVFAGYPDEFEDEGCDQTAGSFSAWVSGPLIPWVQLEIGTMVTASVSGQTCAFADLAPRSEGEVYSRDVLDDAIPGVSFFATSLAAIVEPMRGAAVSPRLRIGGGRLWDKGIWSWFSGIETRIRAGPGAVVTGVEMWNLGIDVSRETYVWHADGDELLSSEMLHRTARPVLFRVGWEGPVW